MVVVGFGFTRCTAHVNPMVGVVTFGFAGGAAYMRSMVVVVVFGFTQSPCLRAFISSYVVYRTFYNLIFFNVRTAVGVFVTVIEAEDSEPASQCMVGECNYFDGVALRAGTKCSSVFVVFRFIHDF